MAERKKKKVSKKNKSSWRKHTDINDVNEFLEDQRLDERLGCVFTTLCQIFLFYFHVPDIFQNYLIMNYSKSTRNPRHLYYKKKTVDNK